MAAADHYRIAWISAAARAMDRLPPKIAPVVVDFVYGALADNPARVGRRLHFDLDGRHGARRGDYRVIYRIDEEARTVTIEGVGHRSDVYRRRT